MVGKRVKSHVLDGGLFRLEIDWFCRGSLTIEKPASTNATLTRGDEG